MIYRYTIMELTAYEAELNTFYSKAMGSFRRFK